MRPVAGCDRRAAGCDRRAAGCDRRAAGCDRRAAAWDRLAAAWHRFWAWYERHYALNLAVAAGLFLLQLVHLYWLGADPIAVRLDGRSLFEPGGLVRYLIFLVDYAEIPALVGASLVYVNELRRGFRWGPLVLLLFLNSQWLHIFWITDEYVASELSGAATSSSLPGWLAWVAILIDYLELPVVFDTLRRLALAVRRRELRRG